LFEQTIVATISADHFEGNLGGKAVLCIHSYVKWDMRADRGSMVIGPTSSLSALCRLLAAMCQACVAAVGWFHSGHRFPTGVEVAFQLLFVASSRWEFSLDSLF
jgi:hypothetical protein